MSDQAEYFDSDNEPIYNIGAVSRITDIAETTLRVWERRYTFPNSSRTDGGHRLYSKHEVERLQWVKIRINEGMQISQAIKALHNLERDGQTTKIQPDTFAISSNDQEVFTGFYTTLLKALLDHDTELSDRIIAETLTVYSLEHLILHIISPIMNDIGSKWDQDEISIATEHVVTNYLRHRLLQWMRTGPPVYKVSPIVLTCAPGELHEGSLLMLGVLLRRLRWPVLYLGQSISLQGFAAFIDQLQPSTVVFVAMTEQSVQELSEWPTWLPHAYETNEPVICFGGRVFTESPNHINEVSGIFLGNTLEEGITVLDKLLNEIHPLAR